MTKMELIRLLILIAFYLSMHWTLVENNDNDKSTDRRTANGTEMTTVQPGEEKQPTEQKYFCDDAKKSAKISRRTLREIRALFNMQKANARKLEDIANDVNKLYSLVDMQKPIDKKLEDNTTGVNKLDHMVGVQNADDKILEDIANGVNKLADFAFSADKINPLFISLFLMLANVFQSTSPGIAKDQRDFMKIMNYFVSNIVDEQDSEFLRNGLSDIVWYVGNFSSCLDLLNAGHVKSGVYTLRIPNTDKEVSVYCDQETDGGGWLVFQRRKDGSVDFYRSWEEYRRGFGHLSTEFWLGNDILHELTKTNQELRVELTDFSRKTAYAKYSSFSIGSPSDNFPLSISGYSGTAGDSMEYHNGHRFYTKDNDSRLDCAASHHGAWWYNFCSKANLDGLYSDREVINDDTITWNHWRKYHTSLKGSEMKIRPKI